MRSPCARKTPHDAIAPGPASVPRCASMERTQATALEGRYRIGAPLERWGLGRCAEAVDEVRNARVVLKHCTELMRLPGMREEVDRTLDTLERLGHAQIAPTVGRGWLDHAPYLLVEPGASRPLQDELNAWRAAQYVPSLDEVRRIGSQVAAALAWAHGLRTPVAHGCLTAESVLVRSEAKGMWLASLMDFGLRALAHTQAATFQATQIIEARAPELRDMPRAASVADDVFAFGVLLWTLLVPWETAEGQGLRTATVRGELHEVLPWLRAARSDVPESLWLLVLRCIEIDPARRPRDGEALVAALTRQEHWETSATLPPWPAGPRVGLTRGLRAGVSPRREPGAADDETLALVFAPPPADTTVRELAPAALPTVQAADEAIAPPDEATLIDRAPSVVPPAPHALLLTTESRHPATAPPRTSDPTRRTEVRRDDQTQLLQAERRSTVWIFITALVGLLALLFVLWLLAWRGSVASTPTHGV